MVRRLLTVNKLRSDSAPVLVAVLVLVLVLVLDTAHAAEVAPATALSVPTSVPTSVQTATPSTSRDRFLIIPFTPTVVATSRRAARSLDELQAGLPVLLADRLARHPGLRFAGPPALLEKMKLDEALTRAAAGGVRWVVAGRYEKRPGWRLQVTVEVFAASGGGAEATDADPPRPAGQAHAAGTRQDVARTTLTAATDAFAAAGVTLPVEARGALLAPFSRDPYAFTLFSRGVAEFTGVGARDQRAGTAGERAIKILTRSVVIDPKVPETRRYLGIIHLAAGRPGHARAMWSSAIELRPDYAAALAGLAALDRTAGSPTARERYARLLELDPEDLDARRSHGELLSEAGMFPEAQAELGRVVAAAPNDLRARRALALVLASRRAGAELAAELAEVVRLDPDDIDARLDLGAALASLGQAEAAIAVYEEVLRRRPRQPVVLKLTGDLYRGKGDGARAAAYYERLHRVAPDDPRPVFLLGTAYYQAGRLDASERMFTEAARYPGMLGDAYANLGAIAVRRGQVKEALWFLSRAAQRRPGKVQVHYNYALALRAADRFADALDELDAAVKIDPNDAEVQFLTGVVALRLGKLARAEACFQQALRIDPAHQSARHNLALLESARGRSESAISLEK